MRATVHACLFVAAVLIVSGMTADEASAQYPVDGTPALIAPPATPPPFGVGWRGLGREFVNDIRYPFFALPRLLEPEPSRVVMRPGFDGQMVAVPAEPIPVKPLFVSGYARDVPPQTRRTLIPTLFGKRHPAGHRHAGY